MILTDNSIKNQIRNQIPWFYHQEFPLFIKFLEYYYEWLEIIDKDTKLLPKFQILNLDIFPKITDNSLFLIACFSGKPKPCLNLC